MFAMATRYTRDESYDKWMSNRQKRQRTRKNRYWCSRCDHDLVGNVGRCRHCGLINGKESRRLKGC